MKLKDCCTIIAGQSPESKYYNSDGVGLPFFQGKADFGELYPTIRVYCSQPTKIAEKDDILLSVRAPVGPTNLAPCKVCIGRGLTAIRPNKGLLTKYLLYYFKFFEGQLQAKGTGTTFKAITQDIVKNLEISIPDVEEQLRIVARIEELFSQLDDAEATLQKTKAQVTLYSQAVLQSVFSTADGCKEYAIEEICERIVDCPHSTPKCVSHGKLCLRTTNFRRGYLDLSEPNYVSEETFERRNARLVPMPGDVLYSREGAILGIACIIPEDTYVCLGQRMMLLRPGKKVINKFLMYYLNSPAVTSLIVSKIGGSASPHVNVGDIKKIRIPIPEIEQQEKLVTQIESRLSLCKEIEYTVSIILLKLTSCKQSILNTEFKGDD